MKVGEVAKHLRVSTLSVKRWIYKGLLKARMMENGGVGWWMITEEDLQEYLNGLNQTNSYKQAFDNQMGNPLEQLEKLSVKPKDEKTDQ